jgi:hypothetical protein
VIPAGDISDPSKYDRKLNGNSSSFTKFWINFESRGMNSLEKNKVFMYRVLHNGVLKTVRKVVINLPLLSQNGIVSKNYSSFHLDYPEDLRR